MCLVGFSVPYWSVARVELAHDGDHVLDRYRIETFKNCDVRPKPALDRKGRAVKLYMYANGTGKKEQVFNCVQDLTDAYERLVDNGSFRDFAHYEIGHWQRRFNFWVPSTVRTNVKLLQDGKVVDRVADSFTLTP